VPLDLARDADVDRQDRPGRHARDNARGGTVYSDPAPE
jgi:hypothetical protein